MHRGFDESGDDRKARRFDIEADRRERRRFVLIVVGFAALAIVGGTLLAYWLIKDDPGPVVLVPLPPAQPDPIDEFERQPFEPWPEPQTELPGVHTPSAPKLAERIADSDVDRGMRKLQGAFDACAQTHGALDGTRVTLDFAVTGSGGVEDASSRPPHATTPLGLCVAGVLRSKGSFARSRLGLRDIHRTITLRRHDNL